MSYIEKRKAERFRMGGIKVLLDSKRGQEAGELVDISMSGGFIDRCCVLENAAQITLPIYRSKEISRGFSVVRNQVEADPKKSWMAVKFDTPLSEYELGQLQGQNGNTIKPGSTKMFGLCKLDRAEILTEAQGIKACASNIFICTMGILPTVTLAVWSLALNGPWTVTATLPAMVLAMFFFLVAALLNIEKLRSINEREGYVWALDYYLSLGRGPAEYRGWMSFKRCLKECGARRRANLCPRHILPDEHTTCWNEGEVKAGLIMSAKKFLPGILDSFMTLTSIVYLSVYGVLLSLFGLSLGLTVEKLCHIPALQIIMIFVAGAIMSSVIGRYSRVVVGIFIGMILSGILGAVYPILVLFASFCVGAILGVCAWYIARQFRELRLGKYSPETYLGTYFLVFEHCEAMPASSLSVKYYRIGDKLRKVGNDIFNWLLQCDNHETVRALFMKEVNKKRQGGDTK